MVVMCFDDTSTELSGAALDVLLLIVLHPCVHSLCPATAVHRRVLLCAGI
jgi:hypothetical protein